MRKLRGGIIHLASVIEADLEDRDTGLSKPQRIGLADLAASVLACRTVNTSELSNVLPRNVKSDEERYRYINRRLILVLTIACFWAVSTGMEPRKTREQPSKKSSQESCVILKRGLILLFHAALYMSEIDSLWKNFKIVRC